nr:hypothetical protein CFP56_06741 [Quercus suber]
MWGDYGRYAETIKSRLLLFGLGRRRSRFGNGCGSRCSCRGLRHNYLHKGISPPLSLSHLLLLVRIQDIWL